MPALQANDFRREMPPLPILPSMDVHEQDGCLVVTAEADPLDPDPDETESGITARAWDLLDHLDLPFQPDASRIATRLVHGSLELRIPLPAEQEVS
jgi:hypothetical protein